MGEKLKTKMCENLIKNGKVQENDVIRHSYSQSRMDGKMNDIQQNNMCPTLDTRCDCLGVVVKDEDFVSRAYKEHGSIPDKFNPYNQSEINDIAPTQTAHCGSISSSSAVLIKNNTKQGYLEANNGDGIDISGRMEYHRGNVQKGISQTLTTMGGADVGTIQDLRIRKLTPLECCKLMGFEKSDYEAMKSIGMSDAAIYHCCGDALVVPLFAMIMSTMMPIGEEKAREKIEEYIGGIVDHE